MNVVREIENTLNVNWFFDNLNGAQRQKVFGFKVPRFGEIWGKMSGIKRGALLG